MTILVQDPITRHNAPTFKPVMDALAEAFRNSGRPGGDHKLRFIMAEAVGLHNMGAINLHTDSPHVVFDTVDCVTDLREEEHRAAINEAVAARKMENWWSPEDVNLEIAPGPG